MDIGELVNLYTHWRVNLVEIVIFGLIDPREMLIEAFL
jgi:hypothetical protein